MLFLFLHILFAAGQYCSPGPTTSVDGNLGRVLLSGDSQTSIDEPSDCPGYIGARDLTSLNVNLHREGNYTLFYNVTTCGNPFPTVSGAWIDYNHNSIFDANETLFTFIRGSPTFWASGSFVVPSWALGGPTRLRVQVQETSSTNPLDPCSRFAYGGTKDFNVTIFEGGYCISGPTTTVDGNLGPVYLGGNSATINDPLDCPGQVGPIESSQTADLTPGSSYTLNWTTTTCGNVYPTQSAAWIDFNQDGVWSEWERIVPFTSSYGPHSFTFRVPLNASDLLVLGGSTTMRVQVQEINAVSINPCAVFPYGGTKDYKINIVNSYCSSGPTTLGSVALGAVSLKGDSSEISDSGACPGAIGPQELTAQVADLTESRAYNISYQVAVCGSESSVVSAGWIDYDQDGIFEYWEQIIPYNSILGDVSFLFKVPISTSQEQVKIGKTRLRLQVQEGGVAPLNPCAQFKEGGTKDFTVQINDTN